jgi:Leucine-rich repeat (LRR) protein
MGNELSQHLDQSKKTGILNLRSFKLNKIPPEVFQITQFLRNIDLSNNKIVILPSEFFINTKNLKTLNLSNNKIGRQLSFQVFILILSEIIFYFQESVPIEVGQLVKLESISLSENLLTNFPVQISQLKSLKQINLSKNNLKTIPKGLCEIAQLDHLDLSQNQIEQIPDYIETLDCIELNLNENRVKIISEKISKCSRLKVLRLEQNLIELNNVPKSLLVESKVSLLNIDGNLFTAKQFEQLDGYDKYIERYTATRRKFD